MNVAPITRFFKDVAKSAVLRMTQELEQKHGKVIYKDYISIVCCGRTNFDHLCRLNFDQGLLLT